MLHPGVACPISWQDDELNLPVPHGRRPITACIAGTMCTPWSPFGARKGLADPSTELWHVWSNEVAALKYDMTTLENSEFFPVEPFVDKMRPHSKVVWTITGPEDCLL